MTTASISSGPDERALARWPTTVLHSLLDRMRELNLRLISVTEVEAIADDQ